MTSPMRTARSTQTIVLGSLLFALAGCHDSSPGGSDATLTMDTLSGADATSGQDAETGTTGTDGTTGLAGIDGTDGVTGLAGVDGTSGLAAVDGSTGTDGISGTDGATASEGCVPNTTTCEGNIVVQCDAAGTADVFVCDAGCGDDGQCKAADMVCTPGYRSCVGSKIAECNASGTSTDTVNSCPFGCDTGTATCKEPMCAPGQTRCSPDTPGLVEICNDTQTGWDSSSVTCVTGCTDGSCNVAVCAPGDQRCGAAGVETCDDLGLFYGLSEACDHGCIGEDDATQCAGCPAGGTRCDGNSVQTCDDPATGWMDTVECTGGSTCADGTCEDSVVLPNAAPEVYLALVRAFVDCWVTETPGFCSAIDASAYPDEITLSEIKGWFCDGDAAPAFVGQFEDQDEYFLAADVMGACNLFEPSNEQDVGFNILAIEGASSGLACIGFSDDTNLSSLNGREVIVDACSNF